MKKTIVTLSVAGLLSFKTTHAQEDSMHLTEQVSKVATHLQNMQVFPTNDALAMGRKNYEVMVADLGGKKETVSVIEELNITADAHTIPVRIYRPAGTINTKAPVIVYLHGGWFMSGGFETHEPIARKLANATKSVIVFVDYRLAPEHPFPAGLDDCIDVMKWIMANGDSLHVDTNKMGIIGDSAGGALAAAVTSEYGKQLQFQVLIYPAADITLNTRSWDIYAKGPVLNKEGAAHAWNAYLPGGKNKDNPLAVPILMKKFKNFPPTLVLLAAHDPLHDEGEQLAKNMQAGGVAVKTITYKDMIHGFMHMGGVFKETQEATDDIAAFVHNIIK